MYVVGPRGSGKSILLNKYIQPDRVSLVDHFAWLHTRRVLPEAMPAQTFVSVQAETPKPTEGLEYTYIRKPAANPTDPKDLAHLWEVSGSHELSQQIFNNDNVLSPEQVCHFQRLLQPLLSIYCVGASTANDLYFFLVLLERIATAVCICLPCSRQSYAACSWLTQSQQ